MTRVLLCMRAGRDREHLAGWLRDRHEVRAAPANLRREDGFDLCILDAAGLDANRDVVAERREAERPVFLPFLLVARRRQVVRNREALLSDVDDVIWAPVARAELDARVGALLRIRNLGRLVQQRYISLANQSSAVVLVVRSERIQYANETARATFPGLPDGSPVTDLIAPRHRRVFAEYMRGLSARARGDASGGTAAATHVEVQLNTAGERWAHASAAPTFEDDDREFLVMMLDVTEAKLRERELLDSRHRIQSLAAQLVSVEQRERALLAGDIHDGVNQSLASLRMRVDLLNRARNELNLDEELSDMRRILDEAITQVRSLIVELDPPTIRESGLSATLSWLVDHFREDHGLEVTYEGGYEISNLPEDLQHVLYRATRELLFNVLKHASGARACVTLQEVNAQIIITVSDDGPGFDPLEAGGGTGFGLFSLRERLRPFDGTVDIRSAPGKGTVITQRVSHPRKEKEAREETRLAR
ncbi:MAG: ATP-binding protein [Spirochaetaceae bacterium]